MLDEKFINKMKEVLLQEEARLELELTDIGKMHGVDDWVGTSGDLSAGTEDRNVYADVIEERLTNDAIADELELRLKNVKKALQKIEDGTYEICDNCGAEIEKDRLEANPAASFCVKCAEELSE